MTVPSTVDGPASKLPTAFTNIDCENALTKIDSIFNTIVQIIPRGPTRKSLSNLLNTLKSNITELKEYNKDSPQQMDKAGRRLALIQVEKALNKCFDFHGSIIHLTEPKKALLLEGLQEVNEFLTHSRKNASQSQNVQGPGADDVKNCRDEDAFQTALEEVRELKGDYEVSCLICYAHGNKKHMSFASLIANDIKRTGIEVFFDKDSEEISLNKFSDEINYANFVVLIGTPELKAKYKDPSSLVSKEMRLVSKRWRDLKRVIRLQLAGSLDTSFPDVFSEEDTLYIGCNNPTEYTRALFKTVNRIVEFGDTDEFPNNEARKLKNILSNLEVKNKKYVASKRAKSEIVSQAYAQQFNEQMLSAFRNCYNKSDYRYIRRLIDSVAGNWPEIIDTFINLRIVKSADQHKRERYALESGKYALTEGISYCENIEIKDIFAPFEGGNEIKRILIEGRAGVGKTTLCQYIAYLWSSFSDDDREKQLGSWANEFGIVLWIPLRQLKTQQSIHEWIHQNYLNDIPVENISNFLNSYDGKILYLLDGYDEIDGSVVALFVRGLLEKEYWITTSRPSFLTSSETGKCRQLEIVGFKDSQINEFVEKFLKEIGREENIKPVISYLKGNDNIRSLAYLPINLELICRYWSPGKGDKLSTTSQLYETLPLNLVCHYTKEKMQVDEYWDWELFSENQKIKGVVEFISLLAWKMQTRGINIATFDDYRTLANKCKPKEETSKRFIQKILSESGLLKKIGAEKEEADCHFMHPSFQEFFAAIHLKNNLEKDEEATLQEIEKLLVDTKYTNVLWMLAGLVKGNIALTNKLFEILSRDLKETRRVGLSVRCLEEVSDIKEVSSKSKILKALIEKVKTKTSRDGLSKALSDCHRVYLELEIDSVVLESFNSGDVEVLNFFLKNGLEKRVEEYKLAGSKGNAKSEYAIGYLCLFGTKRNSVKGVRYLKLAADKNYPAAQYQLGLCYHLGYGTDQNRIEAAECWLKAAEQGYAQAQYNLGECYENGQGVKQDYAQAAKWYLKAAEQGLADAQNNLGVCYDKGKGVDKDYTQATKWYLKAAEQGLADAQYNLGNNYFEGRGVDKDYTQAAEWFLKAAKQGNAQVQYNEAAKWLLKAANQGNLIAQSNLGLCYSKGHGVDQDYTQAAKWYLKAAEQGYAEAQSNLGLCYSKGRGVGQDYTQAAKWYLKAANQGNPIAQSNLGLCYSKGCGVDQDYTQAAEWYLKAAEQGYAEAQFNLGVCYKNGQGVMQSYTQAAEWFLKAAEQSYAEAQFNLGVCYDNGQGVMQSDTEAAKWYLIAAEQNYAQAQYNLGVCYDKGKGVMQSYKKAFKFFSQAADLSCSLGILSLANYYRKGLGVDKDLVIAVGLYEKAYNAGDYDAGYNLAVCYYHGQGVSKNVPEALNIWNKGKKQGHKLSTDILNNLNVNPEKY